MPSVVVVGAQWGDEGKGKVIDLITSKAKYIVRAQGGNNAGHTILIGDQEYKLHLIPSGILQGHTQCFIGAGTVIDPEVLLQEMEGLTSRGMQIEGRLWISPSAHIIFPYHRQLDILLEKRKGSRFIGTTGRGIGPCYSDKANRLGIRMAELVRPEYFSKVLKSVLAIKNDELEKLYGADKFDFEDVYRKYADFGVKLSPFVANVEEMIHEVMEKNENILFEGAQGTFLDITLGTYPFVTSSNTVAGGICVGSGVGPSRLDHTLGVVKAYTTRVGNGPLPSETDENDTFLDHRIAREYGTTTGRKRRIGWFDSVLVKTAVRLNGLQSIALTKLDVLDQLEMIKICVGYQLGDKRLQHLPSLAEDLEKVQPIYEEMPGWKTSTTDISTYDELPQKAKNYLNRIEKLCGVPISLISLGPERNKTIILKDLFGLKEPLNVV